MVPALPAASRTCITIVPLPDSVVLHDTLVPVTEFVMLVQVVPLLVDAHNSSADADPLAAASDAESVAVIVWLPAFVTPSLELDPVSEDNAILLTVVVGAVVSTT